MTTIAYRDGVLAADTLLTSGNMRAGHIAKIQRLGSLRLGFCGALKNWEAFRNWVAAGLPGQFKSEGGNVFIIAPDETTIVWGDSDTPWRETAPYWALGDGDEIATGAMAAGATAEEALKAAILLNVKSGGEITVLRR